MSDDQLEDERIAIIGMAGRFPGARTVAELWANLRNGVEAIRRFDDDELRARGVPDELLADPRYVKAGTVLDDVEMFDAGFFGLSPREAALMDPQQRLFLEACYAALDDAGYSGDGPLAAGVFAGSGLSGYLPAPDFRPGGDHALEYVKMIGNEKDYLASRVAYHLNLTGPALVVQTACSTSLVAVHLACQNLLTYQCDLALAGGVGIMLPQGQGHLYSEGMMLSPDGHCRAFDARAGGYVNGRGLGVVVLKRLSEALDDGDRIDAVIRGSAINNDGSLKVGFTALSVDGQAEVVAAALAMADVHPETIRYLEAFGSGTPLGDSIEVEALTRAFRAQTDAVGFCRLGSIKTNIGHLDAAAGIAGLIKAALVLKTREVPPTLHFERPNPEIDFATTPFVVASELTVLEPGPEPLRAGVSSFGIGGTNAHVILEEPPTGDRPEASDQPAGPALILLSAKTPEALDRASLELASHLDEDPDLDLADVAWTLQVGRRHFDHRRALLGTDLPGLVHELRQPCQGEVASGGAREVVFLLPGEALGDLGAIRDLYRREPAFQAAFDRCAEAARLAGGPDPLQVLKAGARSAEPRAERFLLFMVESALASFWTSAGIRPAAVLGQGSGLVAAACLAEMLTLEDAVALLEDDGGVPGAATSTFEERLSQLALRPAKVPVISAGSGGPFEGAPAPSPAASGDRLGAALEVLLARPDRVLLEVGPAETLLPHVRSQAAASGGDGLLLSSLPLAGEAVDALSHTRAVLARLWLAGLTPDFRTLAAGRRRRRVGLPTYPFARVRHWLEPSRDETRSSHTPATHRPVLTAEASDQEIERTLGSIFEDVLGVAEVSSDDHFLHLGGDSLIALSVAARAQSAGLRLSPQQVLEHGTIARLRDVVRRHDTVEPARVPASGALPITPFLARFLQERGRQDPHRWNISGVAQCRRRLDPPLLDRALGALIERHDSLRLRVARHADGWRAEILPAAEPAGGLEVVDLGALADDEIAAAIGQRAETAQRGLHLTDGPIMRAILFELGPTRPQRLLLVVHHFALDGYAWMVMFEHLERTYLALEAGREPPSGPAAGMATWAADLERFAHDDARRHEIGDWLALPWTELRPLPLDHPVDRSANTNASAAGIVLDLPRAETARLLRTTAHGYPPETVMIAALARALARFQDRRHVLIERLFQGRNVTGSLLDLAASLGPFLCYAPCLLEVDPDAPVLEVVAAVGQQLRGPAGRGAAIDLVRFMGPDKAQIDRLSTLPRAEVLFNYRGKVDGMFERSELFAWAPESAGSDHDPDGRRYYPLAVRADLVGGALDLRIVYSRNLHERASIQALADDLMTFIRAAIDQIHGLRPSI